MMLLALNIYGTVCDDCNSLAGLPFLVVVVLAIVVVVVVGIVYFSFPTKLP